MNNTVNNRRTEPKKINTYFVQKYLCKLVLKYIFKLIVTYVVLNTFKDYTFIFNGNKTQATITELYGGEVERRSVLEIIEAKA